MFRPNRIGDHAVIDTSAAGFVIASSTANFVTNLGDREDFFVQTDEVTLQDEVSMVDFDTGKGDVDYVLGDQKSWSFGTFVNGLMLNDRPMMYSYDLSVYCITSSGTGALSIGAYIGRLAADTPVVDITAQTNNMRTSRLLGVYCAGGSVSAHCLTVRGTVIDTIENGGLGGVFDTDPVGLFFALLGHGTAPSIHHLYGSMSLYRYAKDLDPFDPNR